MRVCAHVLMSLHNQAPPSTILQLPLYTAIVQMCTNHAELNSKSIHIFSRRQRADSDHCITHQYFDTNLVTPSRDKHSQPHWARLPKLALARQATVPAQAKLKVATAKNSSCPAHMSMNARISCQASSMEFFWKQKTQRASPHSTPSALLTVFLGSSLQTGELSDPFLSFPVCPASPFNRNKIAALGMFDACLQSSLRKQSRVSAAA